MPTASPTMRPVNLARKMSRLAGALTDERRGPANFINQHQLGAVRSNQLELTEANDDHDENADGRTETLALPLVSPVSESDAGRQRARLRAVDRLGDGREIGARTPISISHYMRGPRALGREQTCGPSRRTCAARSAGPPGVRSLARQRQFP